MSACQPRSTAASAVRQRPVPQEVRPVDEGPHQGRRQPPALDVAVVPGQQHPGDLGGLEHGRPRVVRMLQAPVGKRVARGGLCAAQRAGDEARDRIDHHHGGQLASGQNVIPDRELLVDECLAEAVVHPLVASAHQDEPRQACQLGGHRLGEHAALGRHQDRARPGRLRARGPDGSRQRLGLHHHAASAAVGPVVGDMVLVGGEVPDVDGRRRNDLLLDGPANDAVRPEQVEHLRKNRQHRDLHGTLSPATPGPRADSRRCAAP